MHISQAVLLSVRAVPPLPVHPAAMAWGDDEGRQRLSIETPPGSFIHLLALRAGPATHRSPALCCPHGAPAGQMHLSKGCQPEAWVEHSSLPGLADPWPGTLWVQVTHTSRGSRPRRSGQGRPGCTRMGYSCMLTVRGGRCYCSCSRFCPGALRGTSGSWVGIIIPMRPPGAACAGRRETGRA